MSSSNRNMLEPTNEDTVQCYFFSLTNDTDESYWVELCKQINKTIVILSKDYIWQKDEFKVFVPITDCKDKGMPFHLSSNTSFGDNIEDEWFIVHLVLEISRQFKSLVIQITDNDGYFLLIEAADYLPSWANPENTFNRVFIHNNHLHLISPKLIPLETNSDLINSIEVIKQSPEATQSTQDIEQAILNRIGKYPEKIIENLHKTAVKLPSNLAALLILRPTLIAPVVDSYCNHDIIDAKYCKHIEFSDCVTIEVKFTKFIYATLMHSKLINCVKHYVSENDKKSTLGLKLTCGYQMIMSKASNNLFPSKEYHSFLENLKKNGYFKDNINGSKEYNQLLKNAKEYFSITELPMSSHLMDNISELMLTTDFARIKESLKDEYSVESGYEGDNEDWLNIHPDQLNDLLLTRYGKKSRFKNTDILSSENVTAELSSFLKQTSDFEGIEPNPHEKSEDNIELESDQFVSCIEKMLKIISTESIDESDNSEDDYDEMEYSDSDNDICDEELKTKLQQDMGNLKGNKTVLANIIQSMKEEKASTGPTSNLLRTMGVNKSELLDSDDNDE